MCGLAGLVQSQRQSHADANLKLVRAMADRLHHRGPDGQGAWSEANVALAHRRLSVVDLSEAGHQPMKSHDGRWVLAFNGEIYNARSLGESLRFSAWRGSSDTEVLVEAIAEQGVKAAVDRLVGMFAFAVFDTVKQELWLARDRLGIKPLYYGWAENAFVFASELHALRPCSNQLTINRAAVATFLRHSFIPGPASIFNEIKKLLPGNLLCLDTNAAVNTAPELHSFWSLNDYVEMNDDLDERTAQTQLHELLRQSVKDRLIADVPLGGFLSGGIDSSLVCALMQEQSSQPVQTFTIGFDDPRYNEAQHAKDVAQHLGTRHTELYIDQQDMLAAVEKLPSLCDEPFADSSLLPTYLVSRMARREVTVALSGDGGDELFWGYNRYRTAEQFWRRIRWVPPLLRGAASRLFVHPATQTLTRNVPGGALGGRKGPLSQKLRTAGELLSADGHRAFYESLMSHWRSPDEVCIDSTELVTPYNDRRHWTQSFPELQRMALQDTLCYLPDDILTKVDRASMAVSLEARVPLLDHRVVEFVSGLPGHLRSRPDEPKFLLKRILNEYVPRKLTDRPKMGFGVPLETWLRGPLREWGEHLLEPRRIAAEGLIDPQPVQQLWRSHQSGQSNNAARLWSVMMLEAWLETYRAPFGA